MKLIAERVWHGCEISIVGYSKSLEMDLRAFDIAILFTPIVYYRNMLKIKWADKMTNEHVLEMITIKEKFVENCK